jgi:peroxiredoxin
MPQLKLGGLRVQLPSLNLSTVKLHTQRQDRGESLSAPVQLPSIKLSRTDNAGLTTLQLLGKPTVITFVSTWAAPSVDQLAILNTIKSTQFTVVPVISGESIEKLKAFMKISNYAVPIAADVDATVANSLNVGALPTHYFIDRHGMIKKIITGVLTKQELYDNIAN